MGLHFGALPTRVRGIIYYSLSPLEQKAFAGVISKGIPNMFRRFRSQVFRVAPPVKLKEKERLYFLVSSGMSMVPYKLDKALVLAYLIYDWGEKEHNRLERKNPDDYKDDV